MNDGILNLTNRRPSHIWIPPIVALLASNSNPANRMLSIWIQPMVSLLWPAIRQPSVVRSSIWKSHFTSWFQAVRTSFAFKIVYIISNFYIVHRIHRPQFCYKVRRTYYFFNLMQNHWYWFYNLCYWFYFIGFFSGYWNLFLSSR